MYKACVALIVCVAWCAPAQAQSQSASDLLGQILGMPAKQPAARRVYTSELNRQQTLKLQEALSSLGYLNARIDGEAGPATWSAIVRWAKDRGWKPPLTLRVAHLEALESEVALAVPEGTTTAVPATAGTGSVIFRMQTGLLQLGYMKSQPTGVADQATADAFSAWARDRGWTTPEAIRQAHAEYIEKEVRERQPLDVNLAAQQDGQQTIDAATGYERLPDEISPTPELLTSWQERPDTDLPGGDIRHGLDDKTLSGISQGDCAKACLATDRCHTYTFNREGNVCFLKEGSGELVPFKGAVTVLLSEQKLRLVPPPTRGPAPQLTKDVSWRDTDSIEEFHERIRQRARSLGASCDAERASLDQLSADMAWTVEKAPAMAGQALSLRWTGNTLMERIPVWLVVSSLAKIRFAGPGHIALGPDAANPFSISAGKGKARALVSLASRGAGLEGKIDIVPLEAGKVDLTMELVGYLRDCEEEITLRTESVVFDTIPAPAEIVLNTAEGRSSLTHEIAVPRLSRSVLLNEHRFLLLDMVTGTEIIERAGSHLQISPTHRFIAVEQGGKIDIIDMVDGKTANQLDPGDLFWGLGDSFAFTTTSPWATVSLASTFSNGLQVLGQMTGPSCCGASAQTTRIGIDLENSAFSILGTLGYRIGALQNQSYALLSDAQGGYSSQGGSEATINLQMLQSIGTLSPVSLANGFDIAGGFSSTATWGDWNDAGEAGVRRKPFSETLTILARVGLSAREVTDRYVGVLASGGNSRPITEIFEGQLARLGMTVAPMISGERIVAPVKDGPQANSGYDAKARIDASAPAMKQLENEAKAAGWKPGWSLPVEGYPVPDCEHLVVDGRISKGRVLLPRDVVEVWKVGQPPNAAWVARADCVAGATYGSLRAYAGYYAIDFSSPLPSSGQAFLAETGFLYENAIHEFWYENAFRIKADGDFVLSIAPGKGVIALIDRKSRAFSWVGEGLPNGDLLLDAWLSADRQHVFQLNADGGFYVHALTKHARRVLSGRIVDDEIAVWTEDFHYDATAEAATLIDLRFPGHHAQYSLDRFGPAKRVAGLAKAVLTGRWELGDQDRARATITLPPSLSGTIMSTGGGNLTAEVIFDRTQVTMISVFQDGQLSHSFTGEGLSNRIVFERLKDARWVSLVASTKDGLSSLPVLSDLGAPLEKLAVTRLLSIGVNTYEHHALPSLNYALRDAGQMISTLTDAEHAGPAFELVQGPKDRRATPAAILAAAKALTDGLEEGDRAVLFLAGHGLRDADGRFYFATSATDPANLAKTALPFDALKAVLKASPASITLLLDACHSGAAGGQLTATNDDLAASFTQAGSNVTVVAAAKGRQESIGRKETGGLFTNALVKVVGADRDIHDLNRNGRIEASELYRGVKSIVVEATQGAQTPWITKSRVVGDYAIF